MRVSATADGPLAPPRSAVRRDGRRLPFAEWVCLTLITQKVSHGWALGTMLAPDGEVGRIWTLSRPLTYRAIDGLVDKGLITRTGQAAGRGRDRVILAATPAGRRLAKHWLDNPSSTCATCAPNCSSSSTCAPGPVSTTKRCSPPSSSCSPRPSTCSPPTSADDDLVDLWRRESARAVRRFLDQALHPVEHAGSEQARAATQRPQPAPGVVTDVHHGEVMSTVNAVLGDGQPLTAAITKDAAADLDLAPGDAVVVIIKSTEVIVAKERIEPPDQDR